MKVTYNSIGQMVAEKWYNAANTLTAHYKYVYDGRGNIVRSLDMLAKIEYTYTYEDGQIVRAAESSITLNGEIVTAKNLVNSIFYTYDSEGKLTQKRIVPANGTEQVINYENLENGNAVVRFKAGGRTITSHSKTDSFGRKVFDELQLSTGFVSRQFHYYTGVETEVHKAKEKLKSSPTTQLVSEIVLSDGRTLSYEYDAEERITKVIDSVDGVTEYTYDALGQLLTEVHNGTTINEMTYSDADRPGLYGNILSKNGVNYQYDAVWKDLLTKIGDQTISYDKQGNPTSYLGHALTWEKGRQLKSFDSNTYTYNANGIRTSKTVNGVKHTYTLDGTKILREVWGSNTMIPLYDNEDSVCGIIYNDDPFYFQKNLQGDVIAIVNTKGETVARYTYDAWGVCTITQDASGAGAATVNPFRYRGYYYDAEISLYYVSSRYYDPEVGRWLNSDEPLFLLIASNTQQYNICCYCENSPIKKFDLLGYWAVNLKTSSVAVLLDLILTLLALSVAFFAPAKALSWCRKIFSWAKSAFNKLINKIAYVLANSLDTILYELLKKYNSVGKARISIGAAAIAAFISTLIDLTPGNIVANLIDRFDKDGKSGYIRF